MQLAEPLTGPQIKNAYSQTFLFGLVCLFITAVAHHFVRGFVMYFTEENYWRASFGNATMWAAMAVYFRTQKLYSERYELGFLPGLVLAVAHGLGIWSIFLFCFLAVVDQMQPLLLLGIPAMTLSGFLALRFGSLRMVPTHLHA